MKAVGWSLSLSFARTQKYGDKGGGMGIKRERKKGESRLSY